MLVNFEWWSMAVGPRIFHASFLLNRTYIVQIKDKVYCRPTNIIFYFPMVRNRPENVSCNGPSVSKCFRFSGPPNQMRLRWEAATLAYMAGAWCLQTSFKVKPTSERTNRPWWRLLWVIFKSQKTNEQQTKTNPPPKPSSVKVKIQYHFQKNLWNCQAF